MLATSRRAAYVLLASTVLVAACGDSGKAPSREGAATAAPAQVLPPFQQEIASQKAEVTLPGAWKYGYRLIDRPDTANGATRAIEFHYGGDSASKVPPRMLLVIRVYSKTAWEKISATQGTVSTKLAEHDGNVYAYSIVTSNPYPVSTAAALRVDAMMLALIASDSPFKMSFK